MKLIVNPETVIAQISATVNSKYSYNGNAYNGFFWSKVAEEEDPTHGVYLCAFHTKTVTQAQLKSIAQFLIECQLAVIQTFAVNKRGAPEVVTDKKAKELVDTYRTKGLSEEAILSRVYRGIGFPGKTDCYIAFMFSSARQKVMPETIIVSQHKVDDAQTREKIDGFIPGVRKLLSAMKDKTVRTQHELSVNNPTFREVASHDRRLAGRIAQEIDAPEDAVHATINTVSNISNIHGDASEDYSINTNFRLWLNTRGSDIEESVSVLINRVVGNHVEFTNDMLNAIKEYMSIDGNYTPKAAELVTQLQVLVEIRNTNAYMAEELEVKEEMAEEIILGNEDAIVQALKRSKRFLKKLPENIRDATTDLSKDTLVNIVANVAAGAIPAGLAGAVGGGAAVILGTATVGLMLIGIVGKFRKRQRIASVAMQDG